MSKGMSEPQGRCARRRAWHFPPPSHLPLLEDACLPTACGPACPSWGIEGTAGGLDGYEVLL